MNETLTAPARPKAAPRRRAASAPPIVESAAAPWQEMMRAVSRFGQDVFCVLDTTGYCYALSENWINISGFEADGDQGEGLSLRIAPDHIRKLLAHLQMQEPGSAVRFQLKHRTGQWKWCELQIAQRDGQQLICLLRDVTELVAAQMKAEKARLEADLALKSRSEFLANMSHELRTPLNAILGFAQMIEAGTYGDVGHPKYNEYISSIQESGHTLLSKVNDLLEIANIDAGRMALQESQVDVGTLIRQAVEFHSHRAFCRQVTLRNHLPENTITVTADRIRMLQVLTNLVSNAIKYNQAGGSVDIYTSLRKDGGITLVVRDNGEGIPPAHLENILSAFRQDNSFFARTRNCMGLGLALSKEIIKLHQGRIDIESRPGEGTLLSIHLPQERTLAFSPPKMLETAALAALN